jgi:O-succinylhomoserine sulfhydrylase
VLLKGLETLELRIERHCENARKIASHLEATRGITKVIYPGLPSHPQYALGQKQMSRPGSVVSFEVAGGKAAAFAFLNRLKLIDISNNLGDAKSLICHPSTTTHHRLSPEDRARLGITDGFVRLSVGLEDMNDITADLMQALG